MTKGTGGETLKKGQRIEKSRKEKMPKKTDKKGGKIGGYVG